VLDPVTGKELEISLEKIKKQGSYEIGGLHYKRVPKGCDPAHPRAELLRYNGLWAGMSSAIPPELFTEKIVDLCVKRFVDMLPLHQWLVTLITNL
ncbi:MAG: DUF2461 family protein, partial [Spirochaetota bacterium]